MTPETKAFLDAMSKSSETDVVLSSSMHAIVCSVDMKEYTLFKGDLVCDSVAINAASILRILNFPVPEDLVALEGHSGYKFFVSHLLEVHVKGDNDGHTCEHCFVGKNGA